MRKLGLVLLTCFVLSCTQRQEIKITVNQEVSSPPNIIFMIGDGMGLAQISLAIENAQDNLAFENCKHIGFIKTSSTSNYVTDSGAGATAFATGKKSYNIAISVAKDSVTVLPTIFDYAKTMNWLTGLVVTSSITHATPAAFYANQPSRYLQKKIASDFYQSGVDIAVGGGKSYFNIDSLKQYGYQSAKGTKEIKSIKANKWIGFFNDSIQPPSIAKGRGDFLPVATEKVLNAFDARKLPFFLMIEGSQIDWGGHDNDADYVVDELLDFNKAIEIVLTYIKSHPNTLLVITADHETGGLTLLEEDSKTLVPHFSTIKHSGIMVPVFAYGKGAEKFSGIYENTGIYDRFIELMKK